MGDKEYHEEHEHNETSSGIGIIFSFLKIIFIVIILIFLTSCTLYAFGYVSNSRLGVVFDPVISASKSVVSLFTGKIKTTKEVLENPELISLSGGYKEPGKKTGLELENIEVVRGLSYGLLNDDLVFSTDVVVNQFPEEVKKVDVLVQCSLDDIEGMVSEGIGEEAKDKKIEVIPPAEGEDSRKKYVQCSIPKDEIDSSLKGDFNTKTARFDVTYKSSERVFLTVFIIPRDAFLGIGKYKQYSGGLNGDNAFILGAGDDKNVRNPVESEMRYRTDVEARMSFPVQPLVIGEKADLSFIFQNNIVGRGNVSVSGFKVHFPSSVVLDSCKYLDGNGVFIGNLNDANKMLNDVGKSHGYDCPVHIGTSEQIGDLIKIDDPSTGLNADLDYSLRISEEKSLQINKRKEA